MNGRVRPIFALAALLWAFLTSPTHAQQLGQGSDDGVSAVRVILSLALCLALAAAGAFAIRTRMMGTGFHFRTGRTERRLELCDSLRLSHQVDLSIIRCDGQEMLVLVSQHEVQLFDHPAIDATASSTVPET